MCILHNSLLYYSFGEYLVLIFCKKTSLTLQFWRDSQVDEESDNWKASHMIGATDGNSDWDTISYNQEKEPPFTPVPVLQIAVECNVSSYLYSSLISLAKDIHSNPAADQKEMVNTSVLYCNHVLIFPIQIFYLK